MALGALKFKTTAVATQPQELGRLRVLGGGDVGSLFVITSPRVSIGRGEENEIMLSDLKMSRRHAEVLQTPQGMLIRDLGSSNGILINGQLLKQWFLKTGDKIGMGSSVLEFISREAGAQMSLVQAPTQSQIGTGASGLTRFIQMPGKAATIGAEPGVAGQVSFIERNKKLVLMMTGLFVIAYLMPQAEIQVKNRRKKYEPPAEVSSNSSGLKNYLPQVVDSEVKKKADTYFKEGYRELKEKNFIRAKVNFEIALQVLPSHEMSRIYKDNVTKAMEEEAKDLKALAKRDEEANRIKSALYKYESIKRLYYKDQSNPIYLEADKAFKDTQIKLKQE